MLTRAYSQSNFLKTRILVFFENFSYKNSSTKNRLVKTRFRKFSITKLSILAIMLTWWLQPLDSASSSVNKYFIKTVLECLAYVGTIPWNFQCSEWNLEISYPRNRTYVCLNISSNSKKSNWTFNRSKMKIFIYWFYHIHG